MKCPHCFTGIRFDELRQDVYQLKNKNNDRLGVELTHGFCPECHNLIVLLKHGTFKWVDDQGELINIQEKIILYPKFSQKNVDHSIPQHYRNEYNEAYSVLSTSPKASAALSRRLLQRLLREEYKINKDNLYKEIEEFVKLPNIPPDILSAVDAIRAIGNFAAHPLEFQTTGEIVEVEPEEAEWLLEVIDALFDIRFVQPKKEQERKDKLNEKLAALGKQPLKNKIVK